MSIESFFGPQFWDAANVPVKKRETDTAKKRAETRYVYVPRSYFKAANAETQTAMPQNIDDTFADFAKHKYVPYQSLKEWISNLQTDDDKIWFCDMLTHRRNEAIAVFFQKIGYLLTCDSQISDRVYKKMTAECVVENDDDGTYWTTVREFGVFPTQLFWNYLVRINFFKELEEGFDIDTEKATYSIAPTVQMLPANGKGLKTDYKKFIAAKGEEYWRVTNKTGVEFSGHNPIYMQCYPFRLLDGQSPQTICMEKAFDFFDVDGKLSTCTSFINKRARPSGASADAGAGAGAGAGADADADAGASTVTSKGTAETIMSIQHANPYYMKFPKTNKYQTKAVKIADILANNQTYGIVQTTVNQNCRDPDSEEPAFHIKRPIIQPHYTNRINLGLMVTLRQDLEA
jgi:hypothetical protein